MRKTKKLLCLLVVILLSLSIISCGTTKANNTSGAQEKASDGMKVHYIDVGQGDSELIQVDGKNILIDAGTSDKRALNYISYS